MANKEQSVAVVEAKFDNDIFTSLVAFEKAQRMAVMLSNSTLVPVSFQGEKNIANCVIALEIANRLQMSPLMVMQNLYIVNGNVGWSSKFLIALINRSGKFVSNLSYQWAGERDSEQWGCRAFAKGKEGKEHFGAWVTMAMAKGEGWIDKNGSKWKTMPELMLQYRASAFFQRVHVPELSIICGLTGEEIEDTIAIDVTEKVADKKKALKGSKAPKTDMK